jgi:hypothetical protein
MGKATVTVCVRSGELRKLRGARNGRLSELRRWEAGERGDVGMVGLKVVRSRGDSEGVVGFDASTDGSVTSCRSDVDIQTRGLWSCSNNKSKGKFIEWNKSTNLWNHQRPGLLGKISN